MLVEQLKQQKDFSPIERSIANHFLASGESLRNQSARSIAAELYTAPSTISRFCKRLGYSGYNEFRNAYLDELRYRSAAFADIDANQPFRAGDDTRTIVDKMGALYRETVADTLALVDNESLSKAVDLLSSARTTVVYSTGTQAFLALDFADKMARIGRQVIVPLKDDHAFFLGNDPKPDDVYLVISYSGETPAVIRVAQHIHNQGGSIIALTSYGRNTLSELADVVLRVSTREKLVEKLGAYAMNISTLLILDVLYSCVLARDYNRNAISRVRASHSFELYRDSDNPILHDWRD